MSIFNERPRSLIREQREAKQNAVVERVRRVLEQSTYLAIRDIQIEFDRGTLQLRGCVPSYHMKQIAGVAVAEVNGVRSINNQLEVVENMAATTSRHL